MARTKVRAPGWVDACELTLIPSIVYEFVPTLKSSSDRVPMRGSNATLYPKILLPGPTVITPHHRSPGFGAQLAGGPDRPRIDTLKVPARLDTVLPVLYGLPPNFSRIVQVGGVSTKTVIADVPD